VVKREYEEANSFFSEAILKAPNNIQFIRNRAKCYGMSENFALMTTDLELANKLSKEIDP
jgi:hypothetical protein